jgi:hypothetical protein
MNLDSIKQQLINKGVTVFPDMPSPVEIYDGQTRSAKHRAIPLDMTEQQVVEYLVQEGDQIAFRDLLSIDARHPERGLITGYTIRYAAWRKDNS